MYLLSTINQTIGQTIGQTINRVIVPGVIKRVQSNGVIKRVNNNGVIKRVQYNVIRPHVVKGIPLIPRLRLEIEATRNQCKRSTYENKVTAVNALEKYFSATMAGLPPVTVESLTADHIKGFERWALDNGNKPGYVALHMRSLRSLLNRILDTDSGKELFRNVRTSNCQTRKRAVSEETITQLRTMILPEDSQLALARDIFLFCFYAMGIPLIDAAHLRKSQLSDGRITYYRQKTRRMVTVEVVPELEQILNRVSLNDSPYLLPILQSGDSDKSRREYRRFYQRYSRALDKISGLLNKDGDIHLTSYVARHSWASIAYKNGVNINIIAQALGHANTNITLSYIRELDNSLLFEASKIVCRATQ